LRYIVNVIGILGDYISAISLVIPVSTLLQLYWLVIVTYCTLLNK